MSKNDNEAERKSASFDSTTQDIPRYPSDIWIPHETLEYTYYRGKDIIKNQG